jgi:NAD(P)-dependent dehydrogenase (short-subunit alcohol dehydrogenase family)
MHIKDRTFVISGGSSGLGLATARSLHEKGGYIAILDLNADSGAAAVKELGSDRSQFFEADVSDTESIEKAVDGVSQWIAKTSKPIGAVISAAGVGNPGKVCQTLSNSKFVMLSIHR